MQQAFLDEGHRCVLQLLTSRSEVAAVMEEMLSTVEYWKFVNEIAICRSKLSREQKEVGRLQALNTELLEKQKLHEEATQARKGRARCVRDQFVEELIVLSLQLQARDAKIHKLQELQEREDRTWRLEKEIRQLQRELKDRQNAPTVLQALPLHADLQHPNSLSAPSSRTISPSFPNGTTASPPRPHNKQHQGPGLSVIARAPRLPLQPGQGIELCLSNLDQKLLMRVFSYLQAADVLSTALANRAAHRVVTRLFHGSDSPPPSSTSLSPASATLPTAPATSIPSSHASAAAKKVLAEGRGAEKVSASITTKLSGAELKGIINMVERLKKLEGVLLQLQAENEDIRARWQSIEGVKDFVIAKLRETEVALKHSMDDVSGAARQRSSDHEVISFLDGRIQELELALQTTATRYMELQERGNKERLSSQEQLRVLKDMLSFEKSKAEESEAVYRSQKKLLAKEVKALRADVMATRIERDSYRDEVHNLRRSLAALHR